MKFKLGFAWPVPQGPKFNQILKPKRQASLYVIPFLALILAVFFGLAAAVLPWQFLVGFAGLPLLLAVGLVFPLPVFGVSLLLMFGIVPEFVMAALPLGGASLRPPELILIFLFLVVFVKSKATGVAIFESLRPLAFLLSLLAFGLVIGFLKGKLLAHNTLALADARQFVGWLALPIAIWFTRTRPVALQNLVVGIAILASVLMIAQLAFGVQLIFGFRGAENLSKEFNDVTRSAIGGGLFFLVYAAYVLFLKACHNERFRWLSLFACIVVIGGVVASFNRAIWAGFVMGALLLLFLKPKTKFSFTAPLIILFVMVSMGIAALFIAKPRVADALISRISSVQEEGRRGSSLGFRFDENEQALAALKGSPIMGVGMGGEYKKSFRQTGVSGGFGIENSYIHNGYLSLWLKLGVAGVFFPLVLAAVLVARHRSILSDKRLNNSVEIKIQAAAAMASISMMYISALTSPDWTTLGQCAALGIFLALLLPTSEEINGRSA